MKLATKEDMEFNISIGEHPHRTYSRMYWTRILEKKESSKMETSEAIGKAFIKELREQLATESKKAKWHRSVQAQTYHNGTAYTSKRFILNRYLKDE